MSTDFLDLLGTVLGPQLTTDETLRVRRMLHGQAPPPTGERPWASGVPDLVAAREAGRSEAEELRARVTWLELAFKVMADMLTEARAIDGAALRERLRALQEQVDAERALRENTVACVTCGKMVLRADAHVRATGTLCEECHVGAQGRGPRMKEVCVATGEGYRDAPRTMLVEETVACAGCAALVPVSQSYQSSNGPICQKCQLVAESDE